jgi:hypothetical protein
MFLHAKSLKASVGLATLVVALPCVGCSSADPVPGSGTHENSSSGGGGGSGSSGGSTSSGGASSSGGSSSSSSGGGSSGGSSGAASSGSSGGGTTSTISSDTTWANGQQITSSVDIASGVTVTIAPGATVTVSANATISVAGTLAGSSASGTHAILTGSGWTGISVASGGTLNLDGVDIKGASTALAIVAGATSTEYDDGTITAATTPFNVAAGTTLGTKNATVTGTLGTSEVAGTLNASYLDYDSNGNQGIVTTNAAATESFENCTLHGSGPTADFVVSATGAASIHVAYTSITNVHCGFHFDTITSFDVSYSNIESNAYGFMLYGSNGTGTRTVSYSNIDQNTVAFDTEGQNGPITFDHDYITGTQNPGDAVSVTNPETAAVTGTGPQAQ